MTTYPIPRLPKEAQALEKPIAAYGPCDRRYGWGFPIFLVVASLNLLGAIAVGAAFFFDPPREDQYGIAYGMLAFFLLVAIGAVALAFHLRKRARLRIVLCPGGIVYVRDRGCTMYRWEDIEEIDTVEIEHYVYLVIHAGTTRIVTIKHRDGDVLRITDLFGDVRKLRKRIEKAYDEYHGD